MGNFGYGKDARTALAAATTTAITTAIITVESSGCVSRNAIETLYIVL